MATGNVTLGTHADAMERMAADLERPVAPLMKRLSLVLVADTKTEVFAKGQSPDGAAWAPLKFPRVRTAGNDLPLRDTGILMNSLTGIGQGANHHVERLNGSTLVWGTNAEHALIHQKGGVVKPKGDRKFLAIPATKEAKYVGSPLRFPRELQPIIGKKGGVLVESPPEKATASLKRQIGATRSRIKKLTGKSTSAGTRTALRVKLGLLRKQLAKKVATATKVQYYLTRQVIIPARPFLGFGSRLTAKVLRAVRDYYGLAGDYFTTNYRGP